MVSTWKKKGKASKFMKAGNNWYWRERGITSMEMINRVEWETKIKLQF